MAGHQVAVAIGGALALGVALVVGGFTSMAGMLLTDLEENGPAVPPELEAIYRQVSYRTGVSWAALAAWDGAENGFELPVPSVLAIFEERVAAELERRWQEAEAYCEEHPEDEERCPPEPPALGPHEETAIWRSAHRTWVTLVGQHVERHALAILGEMGLFGSSPEAFYRGRLPGAVAVRAADLYEAYLLLDDLQTDEDQLWVEHQPLPPDWAPVDGFAWPIQAPLTSRFGWRISPIDGQQRVHAGIDLGAPTGTPIRASQSGRVVVAEFSTTYGRMVIIDHGNGYSSLYAHASQLSVERGQLVSQGEVIALVGSTGLSTGPHLHFEIHYQGTPVDPLLMLNQQSR